MKHARNTTFFSRIGGILQRAKSSRSVWLASVLFIILVIVASMSVLSTRSKKVEQANTTPPNQTSIVEKLESTLSFVEGTVQMKQADGEWTDIQQSTTLSEGQSIRTVGATSRAEISSLNAIVRVDANSEVTIETATKERLIFNHGKGYLYLRTTDVSEQSTLVVKTNDAQFETNAALFRTTNSGDQEAIELFRGRAIETKSNRSAREGEKLIIKDYRQPANNNKVVKLDINSLKNEDFILWNREIDSRLEAYKNSLGFLSDTTAPKLEISSHQDGGVILVDPTANDGSMTLVGSSEKGIKIEVTQKSQNNATKHAAAIDDKGSFSLQLTIPVGEEQLTVIATDATGNTSTKSLRLTIQRKSAVSSEKNIVLKTNNVTTDKISITWAYSGFDGPKDAIAVLYSEDANPTLANSEKKLESSGISSSIMTASLDAGGTYYIRVCDYDKSLSSCSTYSNIVKVTLP